MIGLWLDCNWIMIGLWLDCDWIVIGLWLVYDWFMIGLWLDCDWIVIGLWLDCYWIVVGLWLDCDVAVKVHGLTAEGSVGASPPRSQGRQPALGPRWRTLRKGSAPGGTRPTWRRCGVCLTTHRANHQQPVWWLSGIIDNLFPKVENADECPCPSRSCTFLSLK